MCLAIHKPAGKTVDKASMHHAHMANKDGCGFAVRVKGQILIEKGMWTFEEFWSRFNPYRKYDAILHFRMASMGTINTDNCHPFALVGGGALIHNGHMDAYGSKSQSDTAEWVDQVLNPILAAYPDALRQPAIVRLLEDSIGHSKMVILTAQDARILNEDMGHTQGGVWYSNHSYEAPSRVETWTEYYARNATTSHAFHEEDTEEGLADEFCESCYTGEGRHLVCTHCLNVMEDSTWNR